MIFCPSSISRFAPSLSFFVIELSTRRVVHFGVTRYPTQTWVAQQLRDATPDGIHPKFIVHNDSKFGTVFDRVTESSGIEVLRIPYRAPRANAVCERFLGSVRRECLGHMLIFSERQLHRVVREYVLYFNGARPHQGLKQQIPEEIRMTNASPAVNKIISFPGRKAKDLE